MRGYLSAGKRSLWRFASFGRPGVAVLAAVTLGACASARPEVALPAPRPTTPEAGRPVTERAEPIERGPRSLVRGEIRFLPRGAAPLDLGATVVALRPRAGRGRSVPRAGGLARITSATPEFAPATAVLRPGQPAELENGGPLMHRIFTPELQGRALLLDPGGRSERFSLRRRGPARFYCSLHADETFVLFVDDAPYVDVVSSDREYRLGPVAPGRYTLAIWSERVSGPVREVRVDGYSYLYEPIWLVSSLIER